MRQVARAFIFLSAVLLAAGRAQAAPGDEAKAVIELLHDSLVEVAAAEPSLSLDQRFESLAPVIRETHDLTTMARLTVRRFWRRWPEEQRAEFSAVFERLSIMTYASRFSGISADSFAILESVPAGEDLYAVEAIIRRADADDVPMRYQLQLNDAGWQISNVFADGVSELSLMGSEYFDILQSGEFSDLISELEAQIAALP